MYAPNIGAPKYIKQILMDIKGETDNNTTTVDWLNGYKNKTRIYTVCKRPTSDLGTHTD